MNNMGVYQVLDEKGRTIETNIALHPGTVISDELEAREILKKDFAKAIGLQPSHLSDLLKGKRHVSAQLAIKLEEQLGIDAAFWLRVQMSYDLFVARKSAKKAA